MFGKPLKTQCPPKQPTLVWDGNCGFCRYWIRYWQSLTGDTIVYVPFQELKGKCCFDIGRKYFQEAAHLILADGNVFSGPAAAYKSLEICGIINWPQTLYKRSKLFRHLSDRSYQWIATHRPFFYKATKLFFGKDPNNLQPYWLYYLMALAVLLIIL